MDFIKIHLMADTVFYINYKNVWRGHGFPKERHFLFLEFHEESASSSLDIVFCISYLSDTSFSRRSYSSG